MLGPALGALKNPRLIVAVLVAAAFGALWWYAEAKQEQLQAARDSLRTTVQQNRALQDSLEKDTTFFQDGWLRRLYSRTDFVGKPDTSAPDAVTEDGRNVSQSTELEYEADSVSTSGQRHTSPGDTLQYKFKTEAGRYGLQADLSVWPQTGRLDYQFVLDPPAVEIRLYQTETLASTGTVVTETFVSAPSGKIQSLRSTRAPRPARGGPSMPWSYGAGVSANLHAVRVGPRLRYERPPFVGILSVGYAPSQVRAKETAPIGGRIGVRVMF